MSAYVNGYVHRFGFSISGEILAAACLPLDELERILYERDCLRERVLSLENDIDESVTRVVDLMQDKAELQAKLARSGESWKGRHIK